MAQQSLIEVDLNERTCDFLRRKGYKVLQEFDSGAFGPICKAIKRGPPDILCAVK